ncbi:uncharacterized protein IL334_002786 [Kwoniella shivajii]|uniref:Uncharacterized protein n=1 Tax=Kwoniella shivajii TaxID=564305 RepID=A0ABZ1CW16_9TREE|nr:hypothetical protein IL334_002786 [Kwoniella shivajii]
MSSTIENALELVDKLHRWPEYSITKQIVNIRLNGTVDMIEGWERMRIEAGGIENSEVFERYRESKSNYVDNVIKDEESSILQTDAKGRPYIDVSSIDRKKTTSFLNDFTFSNPGIARYKPNYDHKIPYNDKYPKLKHGVAKMVAIRTVQGLNSNAGVDRWIQYIAPAMSHLLSMYPQGVQVKKSKWPHARWGGDLAAQMVAYHHPNEVDTEKIGLSVTQRRQRDATCDQPSIGLSKDAKSGHKLTLYLPRKTIFYPGSRQFLLSRILTSIRSEEPPMIDQNEQSMFDAPKLKNEELKGLPKTERELAERGFRWFTWLCWEVGRLGKKGLTYEQWEELFLKVMPACLKATLQAQQRHWSDRWFYFRKIQALASQPLGENRLRLEVRKAAFEGKEDNWDTRQAIGIEFRGLSERQIARYNNWLNEKYANCRSIWVTLVGFALFFELSCAYEYSWLLPTVCDHEKMDKEHLCTECESKDILCAELIPGRGALCQDCLSSIIKENDDDYLAWYSDMLSAQLSGEGESAVYTAAIVKYRSYKRRVNNLGDKGHLAICKEDAVKVAVSSWSDKRGEVSDQVFGMGPLGQLSRHAGQVNRLLRPSVVRGSRAVVHNDKTYLFHPDDLVPTVAAAGILAGPNSLASVLLLAYAGRLTQSRWKTIMSAIDIGDHQKILTILQRIDNELEDLHQIQSGIPYRLSSIARTSPCRLLPTIRQLQDQLDKLNIVRGPHSDHKQKGSSKSANQ